MDIRSTGDQERVFEYREVGCDRATLQREPVWDHIVAVAGRSAYGPAGGGMVDEVKAGGSGAGGCAARGVRMSCAHRGAGGDLRVEGRGGDSQAGACGAARQS